MTASNNIWNRLKRPFRSVTAIALTGLVLAACAPEPSDDAIVTASNGSVNLSKYVAIGTSLTAGYGDNSLYRSGQENSFPNILAQQFARAGGGSFEQPLLPPATGTAEGYTPAPTGANPDAAAGRLFVASITNGTPSLQNRAAQFSTSQFIGGSLGGATSLPSGYTVTGNNNWGIPGIRVTQAVDAAAGNPANLSSGTANPYLVRALSTTAGTQSLVQAVAATNPTFITFELGANDVLGYATSGGAGSATVLATPAYIQGAGIPSLNGAVNTLLTGNERKMLIATVPNVELIPYLTTVGPQLVAQTNSIRAAFPLTTTLYYVQNGVNQTTTLGALANPYDPSAPMLTLPALSALYGDVNFNSPNPATVEGLSPANPIPDQYILDPAERDSVRAALTAYNNAISTLAAAYPGRVAVFNVSQFQQQFIYTGTTVSVDGVTADNRFIQGNLHALDGVHFTPRGYALAANAMIRVINQTWGARIPTVNANSYPGTLLP